MRWLSPLPSFDELQWNPKISDFEKKDKLVVRFKPHEMQIIKIGKSAMVWPIDHTSSLVSNTKLIWTSKVIKHDKKTDEFETLNTIYKPNLIGDSNVQHNPMARGV